MSRRDDDEESEGPAGTQRLDKWLWFTRLVKSRTLAASLVSDGKIRVNRSRVDKPSQAVRIGDVVTAAVHRQVKVLRVLDLGERRGPPAEAQMLYEDLTVPEQRLPGHERPRPGEVRTAGTGRPTKRERRELDDLKGRGR